MQRTTRDRLLIFGLVVSAITGCDQLTKRIAEQRLGDSFYSFFYDTVRLQLMKNSGAFLSFGADFPEVIKYWLFLVIPIAVLIWAFVYVILSSKLKTPQMIMIALVISGGIGNLIDRILLSGLVTDFLNVGIGSVRTGIFNVADMAIMAGAIGLIVSEFATKKPKT